MLTIASRLDVLTRMGRAMADPNRARILLALLEAPAHPAGIAAELGLTRPNVSNHLACLRGCGLVVAIPEGRRTRYEIADPHLSQVIRELLATVLAVDDGVPCTDTDCDVPLCCGPGAGGPRGGGTAGGAIAGAGTGSSDGASGGPAGRAGTRS